MFLNKRYLNPSKLASRKVLVASLKEERAIHKEHDKRRARNTYNSMVGEPGTRYADSYSIVYTEGTAHSR